MGSYYTSHYVWRKVDESQAVRYLCFFNMSTKKYAVQNAEFFRLPITRERTLEADVNGMELFLEVSPSERCTWFDEILEAIADHEMNFS